MPEMDDDTAWRTLLSLLRDPAATVGAIAPNGLFTDLPSELAHLESRRMPGRSALDLVQPGDRGDVIVAFERATTAGASVVPVGLREPSTAPSGELHFTDLRERLGVLVGVLVPSARPARTADASPVEDVAERPRFARVAKNEFSRFVEVDNAWCQMLGWTREELLGSRSLDLIHPDDQDLAVASWMDLQGTPGLGRRVRLRHLRKDGSWAWFEVTNHNLVEDQEHGCVRCEIVDISEEMAAHEQVRAREQLLHRLAEALPVGVVQLAADGDVVYANRQLPELLATPVASLTDLLAAVASDDRERAAAAFRSVLDGASEADVEVALAREDRRWCAVSVRRLDDGAGTTTGAVGCLTDTTDSARLRHELSHQATVDPLTGALNRAGSDAALAAAFEQPGAGVAVLFADLDDFKTVNDDLGHEAGDRLLVKVADALRTACRSTDTVGRVGGDEFLVVCSDLAEDAAAALQARVKAGLPDGTASIGLAWVRAGESSPTALVALADTRMYEAKSQRGTAASRRLSARS